MLSNITGTVLYIIYIYTHTSYVRYPTCTFNTSGPVCVCVCGVCMCVCGVCMCVCACVCVGCGCVWVVCVCVCVCMDGCECVCVCMDVCVCVCVCVCGGQNGGKLELLGTFEQWEMGANFSIANYTCTTCTRRALIYIYIYILYFIF